MNIGVIDMLCIYFQANFISKDNKRHRDTGKSIIFAVDRARLLGHMMLKTKGSSQVLRDYLETGTISFSVVENPILKIFCKPCLTFFGIFPTTLQKVIIMMKTSLRALSIRRFLQKCIQDMYNCAEEFDNTTAI